MTIRCVLVGGLSAAEGWVEEDWAEDGGVDGVGWVESCWAIGVVVFGCRARWF